MKTLASMYHDVYLKSPSESGFNSVGADRYKYSLADFKKHIDSISTGLKNPPLLVNQLSNTNNPTAYLITFDDGGESFYTAIEPILRDKNWKAHFFISTDYIGTKGFLTQEQIVELDSLGHIIGAHSASHPKTISALSYNEILAEWKQSIDVLTKLLNKPILVASVPGGYYSKKVAKAAYESGIKYLMTSEPIRRVHYYKDMAIIGRYTMFNYKTEEFAKSIAINDSLPLFQEYLYWNLKKIAKKALGDLYITIKNLILKLKIK